MERSQVRFDSGLVVESDLLTAKVRVASRQQELIRARNDLDLAQAQLNTAMGLPLESLFQPAEALAERSLPVPLLQEAEKQALTNRPDLKRIQSEESAQQQSVAMAKSSFGPRVNAFAGWETDNPTFWRAAAATTGWAAWKCSLISFKAAQNGRNCPAQQALADKALR